MRRQSENGIRDRTLVDLYELTNRFHVAVPLFGSRSHMTSKCGNNKKVPQEAIAECVTDVLTTFVCDLLPHRRTATWNLFKQTITAFLFQNLSSLLKSWPLPTLWNRDIHDQSAWMRHVYFLWGNFWINIITTMIRYEQIVHNNVSQCSVGHSMWWVSSSPLYFKTINKAKHASEIVTQSF